MKISIVTVCYNAAACIEKALSSIQAQGYNDIEKIIIDGGSSDGTQEIVKKYLTAKDVFVSEKDQGIYDAMNKGVAVASGEVVYFLNADDVLADSNVIADVVNAFNSNPSWLVIYGRIFYEGLPSEIKTHTTSFQISSLRGFLNNSICHQAIFVKKQVFIDSGVFDTSLKICADRDWMLKVYSKYPCHFKYIERLIANCKYDGFTYQNQKLHVYENLSVSFRRFPLLYAVFYFIRYFLIRQTRAKMRTYAVKYFAKTAGIP